MSNPWSSEADAPEPADDFLWSDLLLPLLIGGLMPCILWVAANCVGLGIVAWPVDLLLTFGGAALAGASLHRRRGGALRGRDLARVGLSFAAVQNFPLFLLLPAPLLFLTAGQEDAVLLVLAGIVAVLVTLAVSVAYVAAIAVAGAQAGLVMARNGSLGPTWRNATADGAAPPRASSTLLVLTTVAVTTVVVGVPLLAIVVLGALTVLGNNISKKFSTIANSVQMEDRRP